MGVWRYGIQQPFGLAIDHKRESFEICYFQPTRSLPNYIGDRIISKASAK